MNKYTFIYEVKVRELTFVSSGGMCDCYDFNTGIITVEANSLEDAYGIAANNIKEKTNVCSTKYAYLKSLQFIKQEN